MKRKLKDILDDFKKSKVTIDEVIKFIQEQEKIVEIDFASLDSNREKRTAIPEIVYCENKSVEKIIEIISKLYLENKLVIGTRCEEKKLKAIKKKFPKGKYSLKEILFTSVT